MKKKILIIGIIVTFIVILFLGLFLITPCNEQGLEKCEEYNHNPMYNLSKSISEDCRKNAVCILNDVYIPI